MYPLAKDEFSFLYSIVSVYKQYCLVFVATGHYFITLAHDFWRFGPLGSQLNFSCQMLFITQTLKSQDYQQKSRIF